MNGVSRKSGDKREFHLPHEASSHCRSMNKLWDDKSDKWIRKTDPLVALWRWPQAERDGWKVLWTFDDRRKIHDFRYVHHVPAKEKAEGGI